MEWQGGNRPALDKRVTEGCSHNKREQSGFEQGVHEYVGVVRHRFLLRFLQMMVGERRPALDKDFARNEIGSNDVLFVHNSISRYNKLN